jgi:hypothetical protein
MLLVLLLLALPLLALLLVLSLALLPWLLWQRYRAGSARRRAWSWMLALGWWTSLASTALFAVSVLVAGFFWPAAWRYCAIAWLAGLLLGAFGHAITRFEATPQGLYYQSNRWLVLALTLLVAARIVAGIVQATRVWLYGATWPESGWLSHAGLLAVAALLLGYATAQAFGLHRRARRFERYRGYDRSPR